jgi:hypothetical protein
MRSRWRSLVLNEAGASQILMALVMGSTMFSLGLAALEYNQAISKMQSGSKRRVEMRSALDGALRLAAGWYSNQASCDPAVLNDLLNTLCPDGTFAPNGTAGCRSRRLSVDVGRQSYTVSFGPVTPVPWDATDTTFVRRDGRASTATVTSPAILGQTDEGLARGSTEDVQIEVWTQWGSVRDTAPIADRKINQRVVRRAVLLNTCSYSCTYTGSDTQATGQPCSNRNNRGVGFARTRTTFPSLAHPVWGTIRASCEGGRMQGDVTVEPSSVAQTGAPPAGVDRNVDVADLWILRSYLRSGESSSWNRQLIQGVPSSGSRACGDVNLDGEISEADLGLLEKKLRGYLYWLPPVWGSATGPN